MRTLLRLSGGDLGDSVILVRACVPNSGYPIEVNYGDGWSDTGLQSSDAVKPGLHSVAIGIAASQVGSNPDEFDCDVADVESFRIVCTDEQGDDIVISSHYTLDGAVDAAKSLDDSMLRIQEMVGVDSWEDAVLSLP